MTTFTMQDLTPSQLITDHLNAPEVPRETKEALQNIMQTQHAPVPQPTLCESTQTQPSQVNPEAVIDEMLYTIKQSLLLLATVIKQQPSTTPPEGNPPSLQETIELTLQQAGWFKDMIEEQVAERVESEVESYFERRFDPTDHFDFNDAVCNEVSDQIDDIVRDQLDDVVESKLKDAHISINF
jgi:hypothetical protein